MTLYSIAYDDFKREDTTNTIIITLYADDKQPITPDASHTWKAKVSKEDKYVGEYPVTISGNTIKLSSSNLTRLPNGDYGLELWETYDGSTTIYPSAGVMEFRVHRNANDTLGTIDPTTDINAIIDDLHKAGKNIKVIATNTLPPGSKASVTQSITNDENQLTFNIPQGIQGEKGNVGPAPTLKVGTVTKLNPDQTPTASLSGGNGSYTLNLGIPQGVQGETNPTATQALDVANSVNSKLDGITSNGGGRNLLRISSFNGDTKTFNTYWGCGNNTTWAFSDDKPIASADSRSLQFTPKSNLWNTNNGILYASPQVKAGEVYTFSFWGKSTSDGFKMTAEGKDSQFSTFALSTSWHHYSGQLKFDTDSQNMYFHANGGNAGTVTIFYPMLEKGIVAHDWQPDPEDIQSEIDALKEAVKKLGGVTDAILGAIGINHNLITATSKITWNATLGKLSSPEIGTDRFTFTDSTVRGLWASKVAPIANGKKYILRCKIRANESMQLTQFGNADAIFDQTMITTDWQTIEAIFDSAKGVNVYADGKSGDWFEISDQVLIEAGGGSADQPVS